MIEVGTLFEKLLMARVATVYGRTADVPVYLKAAKSEMVRLLPPDQNAVKSIEGQIESATRLGSH